MLQSNTYHISHHLLGTFTMLPAIICVCQSLISKFHSQLYEPPPVSRGWGGGLWVLGGGGGQKKFKGGEEAKEEKYDNVERWRASLLVTDWIFFFFKSVSGCVCNVSNLNKNITFRDYNWQKILGPFLIHRQIGALIISEDSAKWALDLFKVISIWFRAGFLEQQ